MGSFLVNLMLHFTEVKNQISPCLLHFHSLDIQFAPTDNFRLLFFALRAVEIESFGSEGNVAVSAAYLGWSMHKEETRLFSDGIFTQETEIELHGIIDHTG